MTNYETVLEHLDHGTTYSWDLTVLMGLGIPVSDHLRNLVLQSRTTPDEAAYVRSAYAGKLLADLTK